MADAAFTVDPGSKKALNRYQWWRKLWLALAGLVLVAGSAFVGSHWQHEVGHRVIEGLGLALIAAAIIGRMWCTLYIGERKAAEIVSIGPYSVCRNPLYFFSMVAAVGIGAWSGTIGLALIYGLFCWAAFQPVIRREEAFLSAQFGEPYLAYMARTPRFWPNPALHTCPGAVTVFPKRVGNTLADGLVFLLALPVMEAIEWAQATGLITPLVMLY